MNFDQYIFFRNYKIRQLFIFISCLFFLGWLILLLVDILTSIYRFPNFIIDTPEAILVTAFFLLLTFLFIVVEKIWKWLKDLDKKNKTYKFRSQDWPSEWIFNGKTEPNSVSELFVKSSRAGCLLENYIWKNFKMTFEMKFLKNQPEKHIGLVFRAVDLDNYFMLEIFQNSPHYNNTSGLKPHVRYRGGWELMDPEEKQIFNFSDFVKIVLETKDNTVYLYYQSQLIYGWILPTHVDVNHIEAGVNIQGQEQDGKTKGIVQEIPFRLGYGMLGFRAHPRQGAIIRGLKIEPL